MTFRVRINSKQKFILIVLKIYHIKITTFINRVEGQIIIYGKILPFYHTFFIKYITLRSFAGKLIIGIEFFEKSLQKQ